jgi:hypothetical protein
MVDVWNGIENKEKKARAPLTQLLLYNKLTMDAGLTDEICFVEDGESAR